MRRHLIWAGVTALGLLALAGCGGKKPQAEVVARVNGQTITREDVLNLLEQQDGGAAAARALDALISRQLIRQKAKERGLSATEEEIQQRTESMKDDALAQTGKTWEEMLAETGQTQADLEDQISADILVGKLLIPESERAAWFEKPENQKLLTDYSPQNSESVIYRRIVVASKSEAEALHKELTTNKTADFAKLAEQKSLDPMTRDRGGMVGWAVKGKAFPEDEELEKALFSLKPGEISQPLPSQQPTGGDEEQDKQPQQWQLITVVKHVPPHALTREDNERQIEQLMVRTNPQLYYQANQFVDDLVAKAKVEIVNPRYKILEKEYERRREASQQPPAPLTPPVEQQPAEKSAPKQK